MGQRVLHHPWSYSHYRQQEEVYSLTTVSDASHIALFHSSFAPRLTQKVSQSALQKQDNRETLCILKGCKRVFRETINGTRR